MTLTLSLGAIEARVVLDEPTARLIQAGADVRVTVEFRDGRLVRGEVEAKERT